MRSPTTYFLPPVLILLVVACASGPKPATAPATAAARRDVVPVDKLTGDQIVALQRQGYKLVNSNGETLFCNSEAKTGTRLQHDNVCMTEQEMVALRERTEQSLRNTEMQVPPKQGM
jgi:hypothetical protein